MDTETFIKRAQAKHNNFYNYDKATFQGSLKNLIVTCPVHGDFAIQASRHINNGAGCSKCGFIRRVKKCTTPLDVFLEKTSKKPNFENYDFSLVNFKNKKEWVTVICKKHGEYKTKPRYIDNSAFFGCSQCKCESRTFTTDTFIEKAKQIHAERYLYDRVEYKDSHTEVTLICKTHGDYICKPYVHLAGGGFCPSCTNNGVSSYEREIKLFLQQNGISIESSFRGFDGLKEIDLICHNKKIGIEVNGLYWHCDLYKEKNFHKHKTETLLKQGYRLIHIFEDSWLLKKDVCLSILLNAFNKTPNKIYARKCELKLISDKESKHFLNANHVQGSCVSKIRYGLFYNNELVSVMTFGSNRKNLGNKSKPNEYELLRFCNKTYTNVVGGASKLFASFIKQHNPRKITSYCNRSIGTGNLYKQLGFQFLYNTPPNYFYVRGSTRLPRFKFRKDVLIKQGHDKNKTEACIMKELGYNRIYDCGSMKFEWTNNQSFSEDDLF
jgi:hypothetical protein